jgi:hypothetical protein
MSESVANRFRRWGVSDVLVEYPDLRITPSTDDILRIGGRLHFIASGPTGEEIEDAFIIELRIPVRFPQTLSSVFETGGRIPKTYHTSFDGSLCLGAPTALRLELGRAPTISCVLRKLVIPFLYAYSYWEKHGVTLFGELEHGAEGLCQHFASLFEVSDRQVARELARLASLKKRVANKEPCPCKSDRRLGRCHHRKVNEVRAELGRRWFAVQYEQSSVQSKKKSKLRTISPTLRGKRPRLLEMSVS